jgi:hypothetical protein
MVVICAPPVDAARDLGRRPATVLQRSATGELRGAGEKQVEEVHDQGVARATSQPSYANWP